MALRASAVATRRRALSTRLAGDDTRPLRLMAVGKAMIWSTLCRVATDKSAINEDLPAFRACLSFINSLMRAHR